MLYKSKGFLTFLIFVCISIQFVHGQPCSLLLNKSLIGNQKFEARQIITLGAGFNYNAQNANTFIAKTIPYNSEPYIFNDSITNSSLRINTNYAVGSIDGNWNVSPTGAMQYSAPIVIPPGIGEMMPNLEIVYNSQSGEGLLGLGWNLIGLSRISRVGSDYYHDGNLNYVNFTSNDHFQLDGQRLVVISTTNLQTEYRTESESFAKIIGYGSIENPTYFTVETKDGKFIEYGNTADSKSGKLHWCTNKITDKNGKYITFTYTPDEHLPSLIKYTGTKTTNPFFSIQFEYQARKPVVAYVSDIKQSLSSVIKNINILDEGNTLVSKYNMSYINDSRLNEIIKYGKNNSRINSLQVGWGIECASFLERAALAKQTATQVEPSLTQSAWLPKRYQGDFNGDGLTDFILVDLAEGGGFIWHLYLNDSGNFHLVNSGSFDSQTDWRQIQVADFNGDGMDDILAPTNFNRQYNIWVSLGDDLNQWTDISTGNSNLFDGNDKTSLTVGDYDGDGKAEAFILGSQAYGYKYYLLKFNIPTTTQSYTKVAQGNFDYFLQYSQVVPTSKIGLEQLKFTGDGKVDILLQTQDKSFVFELSGSYLNKVCDIPIYNETYSNTLFGDFNGDGKTDIMVTTPTQLYWYIYLSTGTNHIMEPEILGIKNYSVKNNKLYVADINGDGKSDILIIGTGNILKPSTNVQVYCAISNGTDFDVRSYIPAITLKTNNLYNNLGDYNGDGNIDYYYDDGVNGSIMYIFTGKEQNFVTKITDGFGNLSTISYSPLTNNSIYSTSRNSVYPLLDIYGPLYVTSSVYHFDNKTYKGNTAYRYEGARMHLLGKGFLGFKTIISEDQNSYISNYDRYEINSTYYNVFLKQQQKYYNRQTLISQLDNTNNVIAFGNNRILPYISSSKSTDYLTKTTTTTVNTINSDGNKIYTKQLFDDGSFNSIIYSNFTNEGSWMPVNPNIIKISKRHYSDIDSTSITTKYTYAPISGQILTSNNGLLNTYNEYYDNGIIKKITQSDSLTRRSNRYVLDSKGRYIESTYNALDYQTYRTFDYSTGNITSEKSPSGNVTSYLYDDFGNLKGTTTPTGKYISYNRNWATGLAPDGAVYFKTITCNDLPTITEYYDSEGKLIYKLKSGFDGTNIATSYGYNLNNNLISESLPHYQNTSTMSKIFQYDNYGRILFENGYTGQKAYTYNGRTIQIVNESNQRFIKTMDSQGNIISSTDDGGTITTTFKNIGKPGKITVNEKTTLMQYDNYGRLYQLNDPNSGQSNFTYNAFNEMDSKIDANGNKYTMKYNVMGQDSIIIGPNEYYNYFYNKYQNPGLIWKIVKNESCESKIYLYDNFDRIITKHTILNDGTTYTFGYKYDDFGRNTYIYYPSSNFSFSTYNKYNKYGYLSEVRRTDNDAIIWNGLNMNAFKQYTKYIYGNNLICNKTYNNIGLLTNIQTGGVQNLSYNFDPGSGNLMNRTDNNRKLSESFIYDNLNRLNTYGPYSDQYVSYDNSGGITNKNNTGDYTYKSTPNDAVVEVSYAVNEISTQDQNIKYNSFNKVSDITEAAAENRNNIYNLQYTYNENQERLTSKLFLNNVLQKTTHYVDNYEMEITRINEYAKNNRELYYISGGDGLAAIFARFNNNDTMYYVHTDAIGSYDVITNSAGDVVQNYSFNPWGARRNTENWLNYNITPKNLFSRGFTGHEHLDNFSLINMNGRVFDPVVARFLSPDKVIQAPNFTQSYNGYSYCLNNPFSYTDPSGYTWWSNFTGWLGNASDRIGTWLGHNVSPSGNVGGNINFNGDGFDMSSTNIFATAGEPKGQMGVSYNVGNNRFGVASNHGSGTSFWYPSTNYDAAGINAYNSVTALINKLSLESAEKFQYCRYPYDPPGLEPSFVDDFLLLGFGATKFALERTFSAIAAKAGTTVIGEGMARVEAAAAKIPGSVILNDMPAFTGTAEQVTSQMMQYNRQWILQQLRSGNTILDIGLDINRAQPSIFYQMEQNMIKNYKLLHP